MTPRRSASLSARRWLALAVASAGTLTLGAVVVMPGSPPGSPLPVRLRLAQPCARLSALAFSPDGETLAVRLLRGEPEGLCDWGIAFADVKSGRLRAELRSPLAARDAVFSPDGRRLVVSYTGVGRSTPLTVIDVPKGMLVAKFDVDRPHLLNMRFSPDGSTFRLIAWDRGLRPAPKAPWEIRSWDAATWSAHPHHPVALPAHDFAAFSPDGRALAVSTGGASSLTLWDVSTGASSTLTDTSSTSGPLALAFFPDGGTLAVGHLDGTVALWDRHGRTLRATLRGHSPGYAPHEIHVGHEGRVLASRGVELPRPSSLPRPVQSVLSWFTTRSPVTRERSEVVAWDVASGRTVAVLPGEGSALISPDGRTLATTGREGAVTLWALPAR